MREQTANVCSICGEEKSPGDTWFLVAENSWEDKLTVLQWDDLLAGCEGIQPACCADHVEELVVHWMTTGRLDYPFARVALGGRTRRHGRTSWPAQGDPKSVKAGRIGELLVHRESIERVLNESPESLKGILDALVGALRQETAHGHIPAKRQERTQDIAQSDGVPQAS